MSRRDRERDLAVLRHYRHRRARTDPATADELANRPTRAEAAADRARADYRLRTFALRGRPTPPTPEYRAARQALDRLVADRKETPRDTT